MSTVNQGVNYAKTQASPFEAVDQSEVNGRLHVQYDSFVITATSAAGDTILMGTPLPAGARVLAALLDSPRLDVSNSSTISFGWLASADLVEAAQSAGFLAAQDVHTAGIAASMTSALAGANVGKFKKFQSAVQPVLTFVAGPTTVTTGTIQTTIHYTFD